MTKTLREENITLIAKKLDIESGKMIYKEKEFTIGQMTREQFEEELSEFLSDGWEKQSIGFDIPASLRYYLEIKCCLDSEDTVKEVIYTDNDLEMVKDFAKRYRLYQVAKSLTGG